jgi:hypothetical protein
MLLSLGCSGTEDAGGQTGDESDHECEVKSKTPVGFDETSPLGFVPREAIDQALNGCTAPLEWQTISAPANASYGPEVGTTSIDVAVVLKATEASYIEYEPPHSGEEIFTDCAPEVVVDAEITLKSEGGALDETLLLALTLEEGQAALSKLVPFGDLNGSLAFDPDTLDGHEAIRLEVNATFQAEGCIGEIAVGLEKQHGTGPDSAVSFGAPSLARWNGGAGGSAN